MAYANDRTSGRTGGDRPGVMLYFDSIRPAISRLDSAQCGELLRSIVDYAQHGVVPELDPMTGMAFEMLVPKIDRDAEKYEESREQRQYAAYMRKMKKTGEPALTYAEWRALDGEADDPENNGPLSPVNENAFSLPSTSTTTPTTPTTTTTPTAAPDASLKTSLSIEGATEGTGAGCKGEGEGGAYRLYAQWLHAMETRDTEKARELHERLLTFGYDVDLQTKRLRRKR